MGRTGHHRTGLAAGFLVAAACWHAMGLAALFAIPSGWFGGTAPDWLEIAHSEPAPPRPWDGGKRKWVRVSVIPHRTITHWWPLWSLLACAVFLVALPPAPRMMLAGFAAGGIMHLLMDVPNPSGIPILTPRSRFGFGWWKSGHAREPATGLLMAMGAGLVFWVRIHL